MKDHGRPRTFIESIRSPRHGLQPRYVTDGQPADAMRACRARPAPDEALSAVTINAARAIGLEDEIGSLEPGKSADLVIWRVPTSSQIPYWPAADLARTVIKRGRVVLDRG
jgi:imidazolonepropionase-like amidohydrolase